MTLSNPVRWTVVVPATIGIGMLFDYLHVPAGWILAAILAAAGMSISTGRDLPVHRMVSRVGRNLIAIMAAAPIVAADPVELTHFILPGLAMAVITIGIGIVGGLMLARSTPEISRETGVLSMLAGGASVMPVLAQELGADFRYVTLTQYLRLLAVTVTLPLLVPLMDVPRGGVDHLQISYDPVALIVILGIIVVGEPLGKFLRLPAPTILGSMLLTIVAAQFFPDPAALALPPVLKIAAFIAIGWAAGGALSVPALKLFASQLPATFLFIFILLAASALAAFGLMFWLDTTYFEAYLAASPGGLETVLALADEFGAGPSIAAIQVIRLIAILLVAGYLPKILK
ncbi:AbrB family transcriptional regulator [Corynebacterium sp. H128]|uniref:AbrB family transcriptional regulator n=1 Tax=Corynebacterium sp. H128 TaxID=3133427 RepID=UPI0030AAF0BB